jgi:hypothetical protein
MVEVGTISVCRDDGQGNKLWEDTP